MKKERVITPAQADVAVASIKENFDFVLSSYEAAKREGQNVLQWLFGAVIGGIGLVGTLAKNDYLALAFGALVASLWSAYLAGRLIRVLNFQEIHPPGNSSGAFQKMLDEGIPPHRMRWKDALRMTLRSKDNIETVAGVAQGVDKARNGLIFIPIFFVVGSFVSWIIGSIYAALHWILARVFSAAIGLIEELYARGILEEIWRNFLFYFFES